MRTRTSFEKTMLILGVLGCLTLAALTWKGAENSMAKSTYEDIRYSGFPSIKCEYVNNSYELKYKHSDGKEHTEYLSKYGLKKVCSWLDKEGYTVPVEPPEKEGETFTFSK